MRELVRGWKRKLGVLMLVLACLVMCAWMRSFFIADVIEYTTSSHSQDEYQSVGGVLAWWTDINFDESATPFEADPPVRWNGGVSTTNFFSNHYQLDEMKMDWSINWPCIGIGKSPAAVVGNGSRHLRIVPYWSIVLPLTLASAWLILSRPHIAKRGTGS